MSAAPNASRRGQVAVTGGRGRLARALIEALNARGQTALSWSRPDYDLDDPTAARRMVMRHAPATVIHAAAWTDVDRAASQPGLAMRRNGEAVSELAMACRAAGARLVLISTNEVFDGSRTDGQGYREDDPPRPINPYGTSKLAGELAAARAFADDLNSLWIVRTAWLFGAPGNDFPMKILAAAQRLPAGQALSVVSDEIGCPTYTTDLARATLDLMDRTEGNTYHLVNGGRASRCDVAAAVLKHAGLQVPITPIGSDQFRRASTPPPWAVLDTRRADERGVTLREWRSALAEYMSTQDRQ